MNEPFKPIGKCELALLKQKGKDEIDSFRASRLGGSCYYAYWRDLTDPLPITKEMNEIFDKGNKVHFVDEVLNDGRRNDIDTESRKYRLLFIHESGKFTIGGHIDYLRFDFDGAYIEDKKSTKQGGFRYFLECLYKGLSTDYKNQLGIYAYLLYCKTGYYVKRAIVTKIQKDKPRNRMSIEDKMKPLAEARSFILKHPVILFYYDRIPEEHFHRICVNQMKDDSWKCGNCQYAEAKDCPIMIELGIGGE